MSNWIFEDALNWVFDRLTDAKAAGQKLDYLKHVLIGQNIELDLGADGSPGVLVRLQDPERDERWALTADATRDADLAIVIEMWIHPEDEARPYGHRQTNKRGYLTLVSDVGNVLESHPEWPNFGPVSTAPAINANYQGMGHTIENELYIGRSLVIPELRFTAGSR